MNANKNSGYNKPAFVQAVIAAVMILVVGFVVATVTQNIGTSISVKSYTQVAPDITSISEGGIKADANGAIAAGFKAQRTNAENIPLLSQATFLGVIILVLFGAINATMGAGMGGMGGRMSF